MAHRSEETAARLLVTRLPVARPEDRVGDALTGLRGRTFDCVTEVYVCEASGRLLGRAPLHELLTAPTDAPLGEVMRPIPAHASASTDQEHVATLALRHELVAVPVLDDDGRLTGAVPPEALLQVLRHEHVEDLHRLAGIRRERTKLRRAMEEPPARRARDRLPWLLVGLLGSVAATAVVARFEAVLEARVAVAFFIPGIVYLADAIGTQTEAIVVRSLSIGSYSLRRLVWGEARAGVLIGLLLGAPVLAAVLLAFRDLRLAIVVATSVFASGALATTVGVGLPWALKRAGRDPAFGSGPIATVVQDVLSIAIYFLVAQALL
jgi:magnesium transporter